MTKKSKSPVHASEDLAAIDEELNAALELLDTSNTKVTEILGATETAIGQTIPMDPDHAEVNESEEEETGKKATSKDTDAK